MPVRPRVCWASNAGSDLHVGDRIAFGVAGSDDGIMRAAEISRLPMPRDFMAATANER
jgi:hypothetical protein